MPGYPYVPSEDEKEDLGSLENGGNDTTSMGLSISMNEKGLLEVPVR